jgi:hypothetical protein
LRLNPAEFAKSFLKCSEAGLLERIAGASRTQSRDEGNTLLLRLGQMSQTAEESGY